MTDRIELDIDGRRVTVPAGTTVAAAIALGAADINHAAAGDNAAGSPHASSAGAVTRRSVSGALRGPLCGMGVCQECRVTIAGRAHRLACQTLCTPGMQVVTAAEADDRMPMP